MPTDAQKRATTKYKKENLEQLRIWVKKGTIEAVKEHAEKKGSNMAEYVKTLIKKDIGLEEI